MKSTNPYHLELEAMVAAFKAAHPEQELNAHDRDADGDLSKLGARKLHRELCAQAKITDLREVAIDWNARSPEDDQWFSPEVLQ